MTEHENQGESDVVESGPIDKAEAVAEPIAIPAPDDVEPARRARLRTDPGDCKRCNEPLPVPRPTAQRYCARCRKLVESENLTRYLTKQRREIKRLSETVAELEARKLDPESNPAPDPYPTIEEGYDFWEIRRPRTYGDCLPGGPNEARPCPWVSCKYHLALDVNPETGTIKINFEGREVDEIPATCALDIAGEGESTLVEIAEVMNMTRERARQIVKKVRESKGGRGGDLDDLD